MKKIQTIALAMLGVFALAAFTSAIASAETILLAEWLLNGAGVTSLVSITGILAFTIEDTKTIAGAAAVLCEFFVDGSVGPNGEDEITEILAVLHTPIGALGGLALLGTGAASGEGSECKTIKTCAAGTSASPIEVWPIGLPWHTELYLMENGEILDLFFGIEEIGYEMLCLVLGLNAEDKCTFAGNSLAFPVVNDATTGDAAIPAGGEATPAATCSQSGEASGLLIPDGTTLILPLTGLLTASSE